MICCERSGGSSLVF